MFGKLWKEDINFQQKFLQMLQVRSYMKPMPKQSTHYWEVCQNQKFSKSFSLTQPKEIWEKIIQSYEGDSQVKRAKLKTLIIQYETLKMHNDESIAIYFLRIDEVVNCMKNLGEELKEVTLIEKVLRSLFAKFESKVSAIEEKQDLQTITMTQLYGILTTFEMRKGGHLM